LATSRASTCCPGLSWPVRILYCKSWLSSGSDVAPFRGPLAQWIHPICSHIGLSSTEAHNLAMDRSTWRAVAMADRLSERMNERTNEWILHTHVAVSIPASNCTIHCILLTVLCCMYSNAERPTTLICRPQIPLKWCSGRVLGISWQKNITNVEVLNRTDQKVLSEIFASENTVHVWSGVEDAYLCRHLVTGLFITAYYLAGKDHLRPFADIANFM